MTDTLTIEHPQVRIRSWRMVAVTAAAALGVAATGMWISKPSVAESCGTAIGTSYSPAPAARQEVIPAFAGGQPRWVCRTTFADGATSQSWTGR